ncbi:hypothetical protein JFL43_13100 [Viridibacillus sp. YIM B01967]|uniref:Uncharacterized protein n=1 Tax=Viridibacillus soli TaxID=2798301 RepID=A0ABS1H8P6_9BACL|nr:hypothetical protein [Viridibacillus soli]MBK3495775.1 hypothetical protein [Viridibacillus soli]
MNLGQPQIGMGLLKISVCTPFLWNIEKTCAQLNLFGRCSVNNNMNGGASVG